MKLERLKACCANDVLETNSIVRSKKKEKVSIKKDDWKEKEMKKKEGVEEGIGGCIEEGREGRDGEGIGGGVEEGI